MSSELDFELLDQYLANKLSSTDRVAFEQKMAADPALHQEYLMQKNIVEGIRQTRIAELKSMLNNIPVSGIPGNQAMLSGKVIAWIVAAGVAGGLFYYMNRQPSPPEQTEQQTTIEPSQTGTPETSEKVTPAPLREEETAPVTPQPEQSKNEIKPAARADRPTQPDLQTEQSSSPAKSSEPVINVFDPTEELNTDAPNEAPSGEADLPTSPPAAAPSVTVETDNSNRRYSFHYQFSGGKLILYGSFEKNLYEIMEFFEQNKRTLFMFYKGSYYYLDESKTSVTPLTPVTDPKLLQKLKEYREK